MNPSFVFGFRIIEGSQDRALCLIQIAHIVHFETDNDSGEKVAHTVSGATFGIRGDDYERIEGDYLLGKRGR